VEPANTKGPVPPPTTQRYVAACGSPGYIQGPGGARLKQPEPDPPHSTRSEKQLWEAICGAGANASNPSAPVRDKSSIPPGSSSSAALFGAIAFDQAARKFGYSWIEPTQDDANTKALRACNSSGCKIILTFGPGTCGAMVTGNDGAIGITTTSTSLNRATREAINKCMGQKLGDCRVLVGQCNETISEDAKIVELGTIVDRITQGLSAHHVPVDLTAVYLQDDNRISGARIWAIAYDGNICTRNITVITLPPDSDKSPLWDESQAEQWLNDAQAVHDRKCLPEKGQYKYYTVFGTDMKRFIQDAKRAVGSTSDPFGFISLRWGGGARWYSNGIAVEHKKELQAEASRRAREQQLAQQRAEEEAKRSFNDQAAARRKEFVSKIGVPLSSHPIEELAGNPFALSGKALSYHVKFMTMQSPTEGIFESPRNNSIIPFHFIVKDIPEGMLRSPGWVIIAGKVVGATKLGQISVPVLSYLNAYSCSGGTQECREYFGQ
jgi:hypothetical protein